MSGAVLLPIEKAATESQALLDVWDKNLSFAGYPFDLVVSQSWMGPLSTRTEDEAYCTLSGAVGFPVGNVLQHSSIAGYLGQKFEYYWTPLPI